MATFRTIFLLLLPFSLSAQDDYCPCMGSYSFEEEVSGMMSSVSNDFSAFYTTSVSLHNHLTETKIVPFYRVEVEEKEINEEDLQDGSESEKVQGANKKSKKSFTFWVFGKKSPNKWRVKQQRKFRKYKGQCPVF